MERYREVFEIRMGYRIFWGAGEAQIYGEYREVIETDNWMLCMTHFHPNPQSRSFVIYFPREHRVFHGSYNALLFRNSIPPFLEAFYDQILMTLEHAWLDDGEDAIVLNSPHDMQLHRRGFFR